MRRPELCHARAVPMPSHGVTGVAPWQSCSYALLMRIWGMHSFHTDTPCRLMRLQS